MNDRKMMQYNAYVANNNKNAMLAIDGCDRWERKNGEEIENFHPRFSFQCRSKKRVNSTFVELFFVTDKIFRKNYW